MSGAGLVSQPTPVRHSSGDDSDGCVACWMEGDPEGLYGEPFATVCKEPTDDGEGYCAVCGHVVEERRDG